MLLLPGAFKIWKLIVCTQVPHQHGYVAEPMSQEEHDQIAQYLTICEWQIVVDQKFWTKYFWGKKYIFLSNWRGQAERLVDRRHWPSSWGLLSFLAPPWFWFKTSSLEYCVQRYFCQHSRVLGCGCLGHRGLLKIGARVSENFSCVTKC